MLEVIACIAMSGAEKRIDACDGAAYSLEELTAFYAGMYSKRQIQAYWNKCQPAAPKGAARPPRTRAKKRGTAAKAKSQMKTPAVGAGGLEEGPQESWSSWAWTASIALHFREEDQRTSHLRRPFQVSPSCSPSTSTSTLVHVELRQTPKVVLTPEDDGAKPAAGRQGAGASWWACVPVIPSDESHFRSLLDADLARPLAAGVKFLGPTPGISVTNVLSCSTRSALLLSGMMLGLKTEQEFLGKPQSRITFHDPVLADLLWSRIQGALPKAWNGRYLNGLEPAIEMWSCSSQDGKLQPEAKPSSGLLLSLCLRNDADPEPDREDLDGFSIAAGQAVICDGSHANAIMAHGQNSVLLRLAVKYGRPTSWALARSALGSRRAQLLAAAVATAGALTAVSILKRRQR